MRTLMVVLVAACGSVNPSQPDAPKHADAAAIDSSPGMATLTITAAPGTTVTSDPAGISCGASCSAMFPIGSDVTLSAVAAKYHQFTGWSGGNCSGTGTCVVHLTGDTQVMTASGDHCDHFAQADSTTITGWTERTGDWSVVGNMVQHPETGGVYTNHITKNGYTQGDGCVHIQANLGVGPANIQAVGAILRWQSTTSYVVALVQNNSGATFNQTYIYQYPGEVQLGIGTVTDYGLTPSIEACITGTAVSLKVDANNDGTYESTITGTSTLAQTSGLVGIMTHSFGMPSRAGEFCVDP